MREFTYHEPTSVTEVSRMLVDMGDDARVLAGGTALILALRQRLLAPAHLVSLARVPGLREIEWNSGSGLSIGALTPHAAVAKSAAVRSHYPMLADMAARMANPQVRHQGTLGGNLCYADPATDPAGCLIALEAQVVVRGVRGERVLPLESFIVDYYTTALEPDEVLTEIRLAPQQPDSDGRYVRHLRTAAEHRPLINVSVCVRRRGPVCIDARFVVGASTATPRRLPHAETCLQARTVTSEAIVEAGECAAAEVHPIDDLRGTADYRRHMLSIVLRRTLSEIFNVSRPCMD